MSADAHTKSIAGGRNDSSVSGNGGDDEAWGIGKRKMRKRTNKRVSGQWGEEGNKREMQQLSLPV